MFTCWFKIIRDMRRPSSHYVSRGKLRFRIAQILINVLALIAITGGFLVYFKSEYFLLIIIIFTIINFF